jgi:hypothetical protein
MQDYLVSIETFYKEAAEVIFNRAFAVETS